MFLSEHFGRAFWIDDNNDLKSCPLKVNNKPDLKPLINVSKLISKILKKNHCNRF